MFLEIVIISADMIVSTKEVMVDGMSVDYVKFQTEHSDDDQEIDVVSMSIQRHGC